ncbi:YihY/virulence factor BrkB family protein [Pontibacter sp. SGAir0037]|uniref:YihY/virulence factor BrkB family protein n=1 Tax=Pontibacter sp. SGAir0037 TaxID=2571030 RepID=UPI0010CD4476|nr:YihY/virulence factor BrkB family protein [Pontibacter sp. SGAir0037]QCR23172.1 hypothetical protein C1N53_13015 [Pontibacter sp. SGAir0037]
MMTTSKAFFKKTWHILQDTQEGFKQNEPIVYSAAIAFFTIFSLPAILIVLTLIGSAFFAEQEVRTEIVHRVEELINEEAGEQVSTVLENVVEVPAGIWGILIAVVVVVKSATIILFITQKALNSVWNIKVKPKVKYFKLLKHRLLTLALLAGLGILLSISLMLDTLFAMFSDQLFQVFDEWYEPAVRTINIAFSVAVVLVVFTAIHKFLPDARISWKDAVAGGIITSILFLIGKQVINLVLNNIKIAGIYAAAGSFVVLLLWVFYSSIILYIGAIVTKAYANNHGRDIEPSSIAYKFDHVKDEEG